MTIVCACGHTVANIEGGFDVEWLDYVYDEYSGEEEQVIVGAFYCRDCAENGVLDCDLRIVEYGDGE